MQLTIYLAKLIGLTLILSSIYALTHKKAMLAMVDDMLADRPLLYFIEIIAIVAGLAIVLAHNIWSGGALPIVVTLVGWLLVAKCIVWMFLPPRMAKRFITALKLESNYPIFAVVNLVIGAYLTYGGFAR
jgi:hypothetical protein